MTVDDDGTAGFTFTESGGRTAIAEWGTSDTFTVVLTKRPSTNVVINVSSGDTGEAEVNTAHLTFTPDDWDAPQTVTVTGVDDDLVDGLQTVAITLSIDDATSDDAFDPLPDQTLNVTTADDDSVGFAVTESDGGTAVSESGTADFFNVVLTGRPASDVVIDVSSGDTGEATVDRTQLTFTAADWNVPQTVTVTGIDDTAVDGPQSVTITLSIDDANSDDRFDSFPDQTVDVRVVDDDRAGITVTTADGGALIAEGGVDDVYTIALDTVPSGNVEITVTSDDQSEISLDGATFANSVTFTRSDATAQSITVRAIDDSTVETRHTTTITHAVTGSVNDPLYPLSLQIASVTAIVTDNDMRLAFRPESTVAVPDSSGQILAVTDLDGDDLTDVVVMPTGGRPFRILEQDGGVFVERFAASSASLVPGAVVDLDADGFPEVIASDASGAAIYEAIADNSYGVAVQLAGLEPFSTNAVAANVIGDGKVDLLIAQPNASQVVAIYASAGNYSHDVVAEGQGSNGWLAGVADFDGNGTLDIVHSESTPTPRTYVSESGTVRVTDDTFQAIDVGDTDGNGRQEIIGSRANGNKVIQESDGNGGFAFTTVFDAQMPLREFFGSLAIDLDGDGRTELFQTSANPDGARSVLKVLGRESGSLVELWHSGELFPSGREISNLIPLGDVDSDGATEVAVTQSSDAMDILETQSFVVTESADVQSEVTLPVPLIERSNLSFDGSNGEIIAEGPTYLLNDFTIDMEVKRGSLGGYQSLFGLDQQGSSDYGTAGVLVRFNPTNELQIYIGYHQKYHYEITVPNVVFDDLSTRSRLTVRKSGDTLTVHKDGARIHKQSLPFTEIDYVTDGRLAGGTLKTTVGAIHSEPNRLVDQFTGEIPSLVVYGDLSDAQFSELLFRNESDTPPTPRWTLDDAGVTEPTSDILETGVNTNQLTGVTAFRFRWQVREDARGTIFSGYENSENRWDIEYNTDGNHHLVLVEHQTSTRVRSATTFDPGEVIDAVVVHDTWSSEVRIYVANAEGAYQPETETTVQQSLNSNVMLTANGRTRADSPLASKGLLSEAAVYTQLSDKDLHHILVSQNQGTRGETEVTEWGNTDRFHVVLVAQPQSEVVINVSSSDTSEATVDKATLTFTPSNGNVAQVVTVNGVNDDQMDGTQTSTITLSIDDANSDDNYDPLPDQSLTVVTVDDDTVGFSVTQTDGNTEVDESGTTDTFDVVLDGRPQGKVVVTVWSGDTGEATVDKAELAFTSADWDMPQTVTVTGVNDTTPDGPQSTTVTLSIDDARSDDRYDMLPDQIVTVRTADDEAAGTSAKIVASYRFSPPGGSWNIADNGAFNVSVAQNEVFDISGNATQTAILASFNVDIPAFVVNSVNESVDANPGDGLAFDGTGNISLRAAVMEANASPGDDAIELPAGTYTLSVSGTNEDDSATGDLDITGNLTITGAGADVTIIDANQIDRVFHVFPNVSMTISDVTITGGSSAVGGGLRNDAGNVVLNWVTVSGNSVSLNGGGIFNNGELQIDSSTIHGNVAELNGGGIHNEDRLTLVNTTISGNTASSNGDLKKDRTALEVNGTFTQADIADGKIRYEHDDSNTTSDSLTFTVKDPAGNETGVKTFSITVTPVNDRPIVAYPIPDQHAEENQLFDFVVAANTFDDADPSDADNLTFSATLSDGSPLPTWLEFHATTRTFRGTPPLGDRGELSVKVMATDPGSLAAHDTFTITVAADANPWQNPGTASDDRFDVNDDGFVTAQDVLMVINDINRHGSGSDLPKFPDQTNVERHYVDINGDGFRTASDVLDVINHINANVSSGGEGEAVLDSRPQALTALPTRVVAGLPTEFHHTTQASSSLSETPFAHLNPAPSSLVSPQEKVRLRIAALDHRPSSVSFPALDSQPLTLTPDLEDLLADIADDVADAFPTDTTEDRLFARIS